MSARAGFTLIEMIVFVAIFSVAMAAFMSVFVNVAGIQVGQTAAAEVHSQSQFLLQTVQYYVERSSVVETAADTPVSTLELRMPSSTEDRVVIGLVGNSLMLTVRSGSATAATSSLTSSLVSASSVTFTRRTNPGGHDAVAVAFTLSYVGGSVVQRFAQSLQTTVARVSAATFDSNVVPNAASTYQLGASANDWRGINNTIFFDGTGKVGIGVTPTQQFQVNGGDIYVASSTGGVILKNGASCWRLYVTSGGIPTTTSVTCT